jgi:hypothetical protein
VFPRIKQLKLLDKFDEPASVSWLMNRFPVRDDKPALGRSSPQGNAGRKSSCPGRSLSRL